jgi:hypothetical protein
MEDNFKANKDSSDASEITKTEQKTAVLLDIHQLKEGQRVSIGNVLFKIKRVRPDLTIVLKHIGNIENKKP